MGMKKPETHRWQHVEYAVIGERRGKIVWLADRLGRPSYRSLWTTDDGWAVCHLTQKKAEANLNRAKRMEESETVQNIAVIMLTTKSVQTAKRV